MEKLIGIDSDYWNTFLGQDEGEDLYRDGSRFFAIQNCLLGSCVTAILLVSWLFKIGLPGSSPLISTQHPYSGGPLLNSDFANHKVLSETY